MANTFQLEDLFNVLITLEQAGQKHYQTLAGQTEDFTVKALFDHLSKEEEVHEKLYNDLKARNLHMTEIALTEDYKDYAIKLIGNTITFINDLPQVTSKEEGIAVGLKLEKETIFMLNELKSILSLTHHPIINDIINMEKDHIKMLLNL